MLYSPPCRLAPPPRPACSSAPPPSTPPAATPWTPSPRAAASSSTAAPRITKELADERYADRPVTYLFGFGDSGDVIDGFGTAMFLNHSCAPNCETEEYSGRICIRAIRDIAPGEELIYEYNLYDSDDDNCDCYCGAPQCRGTMFSEEEVIRRARRMKRKAAKKKIGRPI